MDFPKFKNEYHLKGIDLLPHRSPFLFIDELVAADETGAIGTYTYTEEKNDFFKGHFPGNPVVPGVVLIESMAQVAGAALVATEQVKRGPNGEPALFVLVTVDGAKFRQSFHPGDKLTTVTETKVIKSFVGEFKLTGYINDNPKPAAEATVKCMLGAKK